MKIISAAALGALICTALSVSSKEEHRTAFFGEDIYINVPSGNFGEVVFKPRNNRSAEVVLLQAGQVLNPRATVISMGHLVLEAVQKEDEGEYIVKNTSNPSTSKHLILLVRDCALEEVVKYGDTYNIHVIHIKGPITLEFRPSLVQINQTVIQPATEAPSVVLYNQTRVVAAEYLGRLIVTARWVTLHSVRMTDEGSFTVLDCDGKIRHRNCLNVREHQNFLHYTYGENLKMKLYQHHSNVNIIYRLKSDNVDRVIVDHGVVVAPLDPLLDGRLSVEGSELIMKKVLPADMGVFKVTDLAGFPVAHVYVEIDAYKLPPLTVAILSLLSLIAFMLLVCLLSCLYKIHKRNEKSKKLMLLAQQAGKGDGEAFREVVHEAYRRFTEESLMQSVRDKPLESTELTIKGLEVSKPGWYQALPSDNFTEMSSLGAEFITSPLPLDSDTDAPMISASHRPLLKDLSPTAVTGGIQSNSLEAQWTPDSTMSPTANLQSLAVNTPDCIAVSPGTASRGTAGSDSCKTEGDTEQKEAEGSVQST